ATAAPPTRLRPTPPATAARSERPSARFRTPAPALGDPDRAQPRRPPRSEPHHPLRGRRGMARGRPGRRHPHPLGRPLQALGPARLRAGTREAHAALGHL
ncbi:MAG: hypothetical protein AVDCRST_MAG17-5, partial [uncultured Solirubrobacterales bacterium]